MSYYKQFIASSAAAAAAIIRSLDDVPEHVREFAATEVGKLKSVSDYALSVDLTGDSPTGVAPWEQASCKLETRWIKVMTEPEPAPELLRSRRRSMWTMPTPGPLSMWRPRTTAPEACSVGSRRTGRSPMTSPAVRAGRPDTLDCRNRAGRYDPPGFLLSLVLWRALLVF